MPVGDGKNNVFGWQLPISFNGDATVEKALNDMDPTDGAKAQFLAARPNFHLAPKDVPPTLIRFSRFPLGQYSHRMGRPHAQRVFCVRYADALKLSLRQALELSGYQADVLPDPTEQIFIWVYQPTSPDEAIPATWGNVRSRIGELLRIQDQ